tara:strand:+ start:357 stop:623 length:267 start_codon:yes stop_codon:yes gene_type:complete
MTELKHAAVLSIPILFFVVLFWWMFSSIGTAEPCLFTEGDEVTIKSSGDWAQVIDHNLFNARCELSVRVRSGQEFFRHDYELEAYNGF